ncbi:MAG: hypothetical protein QXR26_04305 [Candidatus Caldarchaeum sp.]
MATIPVGIGLVRAYSVGSGLTSLQPFKLVKNTDVELGISRSRWLT